MACATLAGEVSPSFNDFGPDVVSGFLTARARNQRVGIGPKARATGQVSSGPDCWGQEPVPSFHCSNVNDFINYRASSKLRRNRPRKRLYSLSSATVRTAAVDESRLTALN
jgi:hypothetical protein